MIVGGRWSLAPDRPGENPDLLKVRNHHKMLNSEFNRQEYQSQLAKDNTNILKKLLQIHIGKSKERRKSTGLTLSPFGAQQHNVLPEIKGTIFKHRRNTSVA